MVVAKARDANLDGYADVLVSAPENMTGYNGATVIIYAPDPPAASTFTVGDSSGWSHMQQPAATCSGCNRYYGMAAAVGRLDGDRRIDLIGGAPSTWSTPGDGSLYFLFNVPFAATLPSATALESGADVILRAEVSGDMMGRFATVFGDYDADGYEDVAVSAIGYDVGTYSDVGRVYVISGAVASGWNAQPAPYLAPAASAIRITSIETLTFSYFGTGLGSYLSPEPRGYSELTNTGVY
jgi:hypothetical protein